MIPPVFVETFRSRPLSSWPLLTKNSLPEQLVGDVTIVGYDEQQPKLAISHRNITTQNFMKAHVEHNSKQGDQDIPPFYFPAPHVSGPDVIFFVKINGSMYPCFVQLKFDNDVEKAPGTVSSHAIQEKMEKEQKMQQKQRQDEPATSVQSDQQQLPQLQDYCPTGTYISMIHFHLIRPFAPAEVVFDLILLDKNGSHLQNCI
ncbi:hypothetical protein BC939DRAFT_468440 [Gamsiella multidivaricata]|uniref:uncharacterized protein n=1 Tax=Gamsiella multidivaricata TaxID=101098 RepID=UPI00221E89D1|nr:uncharacterized protein BC939DRAFT_468440 [Gamsiella multidivaricata]KAI7816628.1 hypothetical protein BC939DRAFT_468440 [Gamsiella multidivaricata]